MKSLTAGFSVRFFSVTNTVGHSGAGSFTGKTFTDMRSAQMFIIDLGSTVRCRPLINKLVRSATENVTRLTRGGISPRAQNQFETAFVSRLQSVSERASLLNRYEAGKGDPGFAEKDLQRYRDVTPASLQATMKRVFDPNARVILRVVPKPKDAARAGSNGGAP